MKFETIKYILNTILLC